MRYPHGLITWADLSTPDIDDARRFYSALMDWHPDDILHEGQRVYTMLSIDGKNAAGMAKQSPETTAQGVPPVWTTYVNVEDVDPIAEAFAAHGGQLVVPPMDITDSGRMTYGIDPSGAPIGFWQEGTHRGADGFNDRGFMTWNELTTRDLDAAKEFYEAILPWHFVPQDLGGFTYYTIMLGERATGSVMTMDESWPADIPSHWMTYFRVDDTAAATSRVADLGGKVSVEPFDTQRGTVAVINDPQGGLFSIIGVASSG